MRSMRRHHLTRIKRARRHYWDGHASFSPRHLGMVAQYPKTCSCWMCGNERKHWKNRTRKELSHIEVFKLEKDMSDESI